jgi:hypothetical protein
MYWVLATLVVTSVTVSRKLLQMGWALLPVARSGVDQR